MHPASRREDYVQVARLFLERGTNVQVSGKRQLDPITFGFTKRTYRTCGHASRARCQRERPGRGRDPTDRPHYIRRRSGATRKVVRMLLKHGDDVSAHKNLGLTPSLLAFRSRNVEVVQILLEYGAEATARDGDSSTLRCIWRYSGDVRSLACFWGTVRT